MTTPNGSTSSSALASTSTGLAANVAGALAYVLGPITGVLFLVLEKENPFVRYHAAQSITTGLLFVALSIALSIASAMLSVVPVLGWVVALLLSVVVGFGGFVAWLWLMWSAYRGRERSFPIAGPLARRIAG
jgi:uncharacterized membrane protein